MKENSVTEVTENIYSRITHCEWCGRKLWKGYFIMVPDVIQSMLIKVVCWRCKLRGKRG